MLIITNAPGSYATATIATGYNACMSYAGQSDADIIDFDYEGGTGIVRDNPLPLDAVEAVAVPHFANFSGPPAFWTYVNVLSTADWYAGGTGTPFPYTILTYDHDGDTLADIPPVELDWPLVLSASNWQQVPDEGTPQTYGNCVTLGPPNLTAMGFLVTSYDFAGIPGTLLASPPGLDLDIDSDNNNGTGAPDLSQAEDDVEWTSPGKIILINNKNPDSDGDNIPGFADGFNLNPGNPNDDLSSDQFAQLVIQVSDGMRGNQFKIRLAYDASDPAQVTENPYAPAAGTQRIWKKNGNVARNKNAANAAENPGDYVPGGDYSMAQLGVDANGRVTLYVEAVKLPAGATSQLRSVKAELMLDKGAAGLAPWNLDWVYVTLTPPDTLVILPDLDFLPVMPRGGANEQTVTLGSYLNGQLENVTWDVTNGGNPATDAQIKDDPLFWVTHKEGVNEIQLSSGPNVSSLLDCVTVTITKQTYQPASDSFTIFKVTPKEIIFSGVKYHSINKDDGSGAYAAAGTPQWQDNSTPLDGDAEDAGDKNFPVCYTRNTKMKVTAKFVIQPAAAADHFTQPAICGAVDGPSYTWHVAAKEGNTFTITNVESQTALPNAVAYYTRIWIYWWISPDNGVRSYSAGLSGNQTYVTRGDPVEGMTLFHTLVHIGCKNADGKSEVADVFTAIWSEFEDLKVWRVGDNPATDQPMKYWGGANPPASTAGLLLGGDGRCGAWMNFFNDCLRAQGNNSGVLTEILPNNIPGATALGFNVKHWDFTTSPPTDLNDAGDLAGQNNPHPESAFQNHAVVRYGGKIYDPSYGGDPFNTLLEWEDFSLDGFGYEDNADQHIIFRADTKGLQETHFPP